MNSLNDPSDAIPASTANALNATRPGPHLSTSCQAALLCAENLRRLTHRERIGLDHLLYGLWAKDRGELRAAFDASRWTFAELTDSVRRLGREVPTLEQVRRAYVDAATAIRSGYVDPLHDDDVAMALFSAISIVNENENAPPDTDAPSEMEVHHRHLVVGAFAVAESPVSAVFDDRLRQAVVAEFGRATDAAVRERHLDREDGARQIAAATRLVLGQGGAATADAPAKGPPPPPPRSATGVGGGAANDRAEGDDRLNFKHYVQAFADLIDSPDTRPPLTIGIFGAWGAGKSFILRHLKDEIERRAAALRPSIARTSGEWLRRRVRKEPLDDRRRAYVYCIGFNAWEYNAAEHIWPRLVRRVLDGVAREAKWNRRPMRWAETVARKLRRNFARKLRSDWKSLAAWLAIGAGLWWGFAHFNPTVATNVAQRVFGVDIGDDKFSVPAIIGGLTAAVKLLVDTLLAPLGGWVTALLDDGPGYGAETDFVRAIRADLDLVDGQLVADGARVLIMIDDLDRCEPDKAVEVLQAINLLLDRRSFIVCLGIDARVITAAVEKHYEDLLGPAGITGYEYLDKIIQIPFRIPDPTGDEVALLVSKQLGDPPEPEAPNETKIETSSQSANASPDALPLDGRLTRAANELDRTLASPLGNLIAGVSPAGAAVGRAAVNAAQGFVTPPAATPERLSFTHDELKAFHEIRDCIRPNPRHVKRLVNVYALVRSLATLSGNRAILDDPAGTVRWLTLCAQWPYAVHNMLRHLDTHGRPGDGPDTLPPLRHLYDAVRDGLDPVKRARFDHDMTGLDRLIASSEGISWDELRVLRGYTVNFNPALDSELRASDAAPSRRRSTPGRRSPQYDRREPVAE